MRKSKPTVALIYDFDGTLSPLNMQEYDFLKAIDVKDKSKFWAENAEMVSNNNANNILCYMKLMLDKAHAAHVSIKRQQFVDFGKSIELYNGVKEWFGEINELGKSIGVKIEHYINSSGLREMIEGTPIAKEFKEIYACSFLYVDDVAVWPSVAVDFTTKTQFLFMINKGISKISDNASVNDYTPDEDRPIPFRHMLYFGDGETDIPCMKLVKQQGGCSFAVYKPYSSKKRAAAEKLVKEDRVNFVCPADYSKNSDLYKIVETVIGRIKYNYDFRTLEINNHKRFDKGEKLIDRKKS